MIDAWLIANTYPGMAFWAGTGPPKAKCGSCEYHQSMDRRGSARRCAKYRDMMMGSKGDVIPPGAHSRKYYKPVAKKGPRNA